MRTKKYIDLTMILSNETPVFPGDPRVLVNPLYTIEKDGCAVQMLRMNNHNGTHIDAPSHFIKSGKSLDAFPLTQFTGEAIKIVAKDKKRIDIDILSNINLQKGSIVLLQTGHSQKADELTYHQNYPTVSEKLAARLVSAGIKMVGIDSPSIDKDPYPVHKLLLSRDILILENLVNLDLLPQKGFQIIALPLRLAADGAPARVIAEVEG